jgi:hypothetical protein
MKKALFVAFVLMAYAPNADAFNYIFLEGKGVGGKMACSDWNRISNSRGERAAMIQWVFGFITGYDVAIRPDPSDGSLNGQPIVDLIVKLCKEHPDSDLTSVAKSIAVYLEKEVKGEVDQPIILNLAAGTNPDKWVIVKNLTANTCAVLATKPSDKNLVTITTFKAFMMDGKATKDMVMAKCGCEKGCDFELPR